MTKGHSIGSSKPNGNNPNECFDSIIIGSSPICLIEAIHQVRQGRTVCVIDSDAKIGGAWRSIEAFGFKDVEISTHIIRHYRKGYRYLSKNLGINLDRMKPQPFWLLPSYKFMPRRTRYSYHWNHELYRAMDSLLTADGLRQAFISPRKSIIGPVLSASIRFMKYVKTGLTPAYYPLGGAPELVRCLSDRAQEEGVEFHHQLNISSIAVNGTNFPVLAHTNCGQLYKCKNIFITRQTRLDAIQSFGTTLKMESVPCNTTHLHMLVADASPRKFTFVRFRNDSSYEMLSDISRYTPEFTTSRPKHKLLAAWWKGATHPTEDLVKIEIEKLKNENLLSPEAILEQLEVTTYNSKRLTNDSVSRIDSVKPGLITILNTENLSENIAEYSNRWSRK